jgi:hypothetical protein
MQSLRLREAYLLRRYLEDRAPGSALHGKVAFPLEAIGRESRNFKEVISAPTFYPSGFPRIAFGGSSVSEKPQCRKLVSEKQPALDSSLNRGNPRF